MKAKKNKSSAEKLVEEVLVEADQLTEITENMVREQLSELFSPNVKRAINKVITEGSENRKYEEEMSDDDLEDLERALEEGDDEDEDWNFEEDGGEGDSDSDGEGDEEYDDESMEESDYSDELEDEEELDEETPANYDEDDYDFIEELREILEADDEEDDDYDDVDVEDKEDLDEGEDGGSYTEKAPKVKMDEEEGDGKSDDSSDLSEDKEGGSYTEKAPKVKMDEEELAEVLAENKRYKSALRKAVKSLKEANLDSKKMNAVERIISERKVGERGKLRITSAIDKAKNEKDILVLESALSRQYPKRKKSVQESKKRSLANKSRRQKPAKKSIKESKADIIAPFGKRMAEIAGISKNK